MLTAESERPSTLGGKAATSYIIVLAFLFVISFLYLH